MNIAIYGGSGPLARNLSEFLNLHGHHVTTMSRRDNSMEFDLKAFASNDFSRYDFVLHLAHDYKANNRDFDVILTQHAALLKNNKTGFVYFSSMSSHGENTSRYSYQKQEMEKVFASFGQTVIRLGLVYSGENTPEKNRPIKQIAKVLHYLRFLSNDEKNSSMYYLTSFHDVEFKVLEILDKNIPISIQDVYSLGPLSASQLYSFIARNPSNLKISSFPIDLFLRLIFLSPVYDKFLNFVNGMKTAK